MARKKTKAAKATSKQRASWQGALTFGLVSFPVEAFNALDRSGSDIHFHQLHAECHSRIRYAKTCPIHGEVTKEEIVSGYEYKKGKYIEMEPEELEELRTENDRALKIDAFVSPETVDPLYFDGRMYYLAPDGAAAVEPYAVIAEAMERADRYGIGQIVFSGKEQIVLVRPVSGVLHMAMLNYEAEIRPASKLAGEIKPKASIARHVRLAQTLVEEWTDDEFDFSSYEDQYREKLQDLIEAKVSGHEIVAPKQEKAPKVLNLMDALKRSVEAHSKRPAKPAPRRKSG